MKIRNIVLFVGLIFLLLAISVSSQNWPTRPIDVIVGWSAGGTSDTTVRALAREMSEFLGVEIRVSNMAGANGGIAYQNVYQAAADGYKWFGGAQVQATYPITKQAEIGWEEFYAFPAGMGATTIYVRTDSGYNTIQDLVDFIKKSSGTIKYGTTSRGGNGHIFGEAFADAAGVKDKVQDIPYDGGREAGNYLIAKAVEYISVSLGDVADWAEEGTLKPLLNLYPKDYEWRGVLFPSINNYYPSLEPYTSINPYWGVAIRRDTPADVVIKIAEAFKYAVEQQRFEEALIGRGIIVAPLMGEAADKAVAMVGSGRGWAQFDYGIVDTSPADFNIPRLADWKWPYNESSAKVRPWPEKVEEIFSQLEK
ncbi:MAG: tripartite tricarboxylate transporter substrate binding protein [Candidatus Caldatribacteriota bacterium]